MNEQPGDFFKGRESKTQEASISIEGIELESIKDNKLGYDCIQCEIGGGSCPRHPRDINDLIIIPNKSTSSQKPPMDDEEHDGGMRMAIQAELEQELNLDQPMSPGDLQKYFGGFEKKNGAKKPLNPEGV